MHCKEGIQINIAMITSRYRKICWLQSGTVVVGSLMFMLTCKRTMCSTSRFPIMANSSSNWGQYNRISTHCSKEWPAHEDLPLRGIPYFKAFFLNCHQVREAYTYVTVTIFWFIGTANESSRKDIAFLVLYTGCVVHNYPDINPTIRRFALVQLCTINQEHQNHVIG